jgi:hypothetical protein
LRRRGSETALRNRSQARKSRREEASRVAPGAGEIEALHPLPGGRWTLIMDEVHGPVSFGRRDHLGVSKS